MDPVTDIKSRLTIEELVSRYCQLQKKGRNFVALCPFHNDTKPSLQVSPDKGIAYCFACRSGGDIFSFYQKIEGVDFPQAVRELAERAGVTLAPREEFGSGVSSKDVKERLRECLQCALRFYQDCLKNSAAAKDYLHRRGIPDSQVSEFFLGFAPDSFSSTYEHLLKEGFSRSDILQAGLGIQRDLDEERIYDRFRNRLMFPIFDLQGKLVAFGGRTLGEDDAKYINSSEGPLYSKANVLYGLNAAKEAVRETKRAVLVEGYFDVLACHKVGAMNVCAVSGTALTKSHAKLLARLARSVTLCLDQDRAGQEASERSFAILAQEGLVVEVLSLPMDEKSRQPFKDPDEAAAVAPELLRQCFAGGGKPYVEAALQRLSTHDLSDALRRREALERVLALLAALPFASEQALYLHMAASLFGTTETALKDDLAAAKRRLSAGQSQPKHRSSGDPRQSSDTRIGEFSRVEIALGLFLLYPELRSLLDELIPPEQGFAAALYGAVKESLSIQQLPAEHRERAAVLQLFCEHHEFTDWSEAQAQREIRKNCAAANREALRAKQQEITGKLLEARAKGKTTEELELQTKYLQLLKLAKMMG